MIGFFWMLRHNLNWTGGYLLGSSSWSLPWELVWVVARLEDDLLPARRTRACQMQVSLFALPPLSLSRSSKFSCLTFISRIFWKHVFLQCLFLCKAWGAWSTFHIFFTIFSPLHSPQSDRCLFSAGQVKNGQLPTKTKKTGAGRLKRWQSWRSTKWPRKILPRFWRLPENAWKGFSSNRDLTCPMNYAGKATSKDFRMWYQQGTFAHKWAIDVIFKLSPCSGSSKSDMASKLRFRAG